MDLEAQVNELQSQLHAAQAQARGTAATPGSALAVEWLPAAPETHSVTAHQGGVTVLVPHPVFDAVVSCGDDGLCHVWGLLEGLLQRERTLRGHTAGVTCAAFAPSGQRLATGSADSRIKVWDFSPTAAAAGSGAGCIRTLAGHENTVTGVVFTPDGAALLSSSKDGTVRLWDVAGGQCSHTFTAHAGGVRALDLSPDARLLATTGSDGQVSVWTVGSGNKVNSGAPARVLAAGAKSVEVMRFAPAAQAKRLVRKRLHKQRVQEVGKQLQFDMEDAAAAPEERLPAASAAGGGSSSGASASTAGIPAVLLCGGRDNTLFVHDADTGDCWMSLACHSSWIKAVEWHPSGTLVASVAEGCDMHFVDILGNTSIRQLSGIHDTFATAMTICAASRTVVSGAMNGRLSVWSSS